MQAKEALEAGLAQLVRDTGWPLPGDLQEQLLQYVSLLIKWNRVYNLTAVHDSLAIVERHLLDSLSLLRWLPATSCTSDKLTDVMDIGSGAGLPVLPLAMARPDLEFVSVESNGKKTRFQHQVLVELGLKNVIVKNQRVQDVSQQAVFITSRAFTAPEPFLQLTQPLCVPRSLVVLMLAHAGAMPESLPAPFALEELMPLQVPGTSAPRHIALCRYRA